MGAFTKPRLQRASFPAGDGKTTGHRSLLASGSFELEAARNLFEMFKQSRMSTKVEAAGPWEAKFAALSFS
jgi:hypothetical protein